MCDQLRRFSCVTGLLIAMAACVTDEVPHVQRVVGAQTSELIGTRRVAYRAARIPVVDMHLHTGRWDLLPQQMQDAIRENLPFPLNLAAEQTVNFTLSSTGIASQLLTSNIEKAVLFAVYAPETTGTAPNALVRERIAAIPSRFYGLASVSVDNWATDADQQLAELAQYLSLPEFIGVKLAHPHMGIAFNDRQYDGIYETAGTYGVPVYVHTGNTPAMGSRRDPAATDPAYLEPVIVDFPDVKFILGHSGYNFLQKNTGYLETCLALASKYPNVFLEASALGSSNSDPTSQNLATVLRAIKEASLVDRLLYGSDGPQRIGFVGDYLKRTLTAMEAANYDVNDASLFLYENFQRAFGIKL